MLANEGTGRQGVCTVHYSERVGVGKLQRHREFVVCVL